jgi:acetyl esterase/lipase
MMNELRRTMALLPKLDFSQPQGVRDRIHLFIKISAAAGLRPSRHSAVEVRDTATPWGVRLRVYVPAVAEPMPPAIIYFHGGAFVVGDLELEHPRCLEMAYETAAVVIAVDYRLAPEHPFPAAFEDCWNVLTWVMEGGGLGIDPTRVAVAGASAGGALAAAVCLRARDLGSRAPCFQLLIYPVLDDRMTTRSMVEYFDIPGWSGRNSQHMWKHYLGKECHHTSPYAAPARATRLEGVARAYVMTADLDALRDEGIAYATRLISDGVSTEFHHYPGAFHGFDTLSNTEMSRCARAEHYAALRRALTTGCETCLATTAKRRTASPAF